MTITRFPRTPALLIVMALIAGGIPVRPMYAAGFVVNSLGDTAMPTAGDGFCTLREAIASANNAGNGDCGPDSAADDTITFNVSGTITLASVLPPIASGAGALTIDGGGNIAISGDGSEQVLLINPGTNLTLQSLTITNGDSFGFGSGIQNSGTLTVTNSVLSNNAAGYGAGIDNTGTLTITNSIFSNNAATTSGGILNAGTLTITNSSFSNNAATTSSSGIYNAGTLTITNSLLANNTADYSAGIFNGTAGTLTITNSRLANNIASDSSSGIANSGTLTVTNSTFSTNQAGTLDGGGIYNRPQDGNDDSSATCDIGSYELDVTPPTVTSITRADPNPTNATSVNFTVTFSESVTGVDSSDFSLNPTGGVSGASITSVSGFGSSYTVTVNTGTGSGTLRLDIPATWSRRRRTQSIGTSRQRDATSGYSCNGHDYRPDR